MWFESTLLYMAMCHSIARRNPMSRKPHANCLFCAEDNQVCSTCEWRKEPKQKKEAFVRLCVEKVQALKPEEVEY
jgi:hypothetical protein